jgi:hypothetical protein
LQPDLEFDDFKLHSNRAISDCIRRFNGSNFSSDDRGILKEEVSTYLMAQSSLFNSKFFFICISVVYGFKYFPWHKKSYTFYSFEWGKKKEKKIAEWGRENRAVKLFYM